VLRTLDKSYHVSAQNASATGTGAYTGEIAATQLKDFGINWVILGHSERRQLYHASDATVAKQTTIALSSGLSVIACVGETLEERKANKTWAVIEKQLNAIVSAVKADQWPSIVIAYEPVWAIGTGETATPQQAQDVHRQIRQWAASKVSKDVAAKLRIIYGGSVKGSNADELLGQSDIDGFLVGGASLQADDWQKIVTAPTRLKSKL
jgi:triosephosphate isomerase